MGFGGTIVAAAFSVIVLVICIYMLNEWIGGDVVLGFFTSIVKALGKMMETITHAFESGSIPDLSDVGIGGGS